MCDVNNFYTPCHLCYLYLIKPIQVWGGGLYFQPNKCQHCSHIETSTANQLTGFFMRATLAFNGLR